MHLKFDNNGHLNLRNPRLFHEHISKNSPSEPIGHKQYSKLPFLTKNQQFQGGEIYDNVQNIAKHQKVQKNILDHHHSVVNSIKIPHRKINNLKFEL